MSVSLSAGGTWSGREKYEGAQKYLTDSPARVWAMDRSGWIAFYTIESDPASHSSGGLGNIPERKGAGTIKTGRYERQGVG